MPRWRHCIAAMWRWPRPRHERGDAVSGATLVVRCPNCAKPVTWGPASPHRPFCSARCRQLDFGDWAGERHRIPGEPAQDETNLDDPAQE